MKRARASFSVAADVLPPRVLDFWVCCFPAPPSSALSLQSESDDTFTEGLVVPCSGGVSLSSDDDPLAPSLILFTKSSFCGSWAFSGWFSCRPLFSAIIFIPASLPFSILFVFWPSKVMEGRAALLEASGLGFWMLQWL